MKKLFIFDVRTPEEYENGFKENAINLPLEDVYNNTSLAKSVLKDVAKDDEIRVYCFSGARAEMVKKILNGMGYTNVFNLGGFK